MNGKLSNDLAKSLAARLKAEKKTPQDRVDYAFRLIAGRAPNANERTLAMKYLDDPDPAAETEFALSLFNTNAFLYVN